MTIRVSLWTTITTTKPVIHGLLERLWEPSGFPLFWVKEREIIVKTLILTNSFDATSDVVVDHLTGDSLFRWNFDLPLDYKVAITSQGFTIDNGIQQVTQADIRCVYWRKPYMDAGPENPPWDAYGPAGKFVREELVYLFREVWYRVARSVGYSLVRPDAERSFGKIQQLLTARSYFRVPDWQWSIGQSVGGSDPRIAKSLTSTPIEMPQGRRVMYTTRVSPAELDPSYPWLVQDLVEASDDVTVVYVEGKCFAARCPRTFEGLDWRAHIGTENIDFVPYQLSTRDEENIRQFMKAAGLHYGRLDFLLQAGELVFLEVNPNGQWAWLVPCGVEGLLETMGQCIVRPTEILPL